MKRLISFILLFASLFVLTSCKDNDLHIDTVLTPPVVSTPFFSEETVNKAAESHVVVRYTGAFNTKENPLIPHYSYVESDGVIFLHKKSLKDTFYVLTMQPSYRLTDNLQAKDYFIFLNNYSIPADSVKKLEIDSKSDNGLERLTDFMDLFVLTFTCNKTAIETQIGRSITALGDADFSTLLTDTTSSLLDLSEQEQNIFSIAHDSMPGQLFQYSRRTSFGHIASIGRRQEILNPYKRASLSNNSVITSRVEVDMVLNNGNFAAPIFDYEGKFLGIFISKFSVSSQVNLDKMTTMLPSFVFKKALQETYLQDF